MILRRFMKHVTDQNWFAVGLDVIVVIVGIFLGLQFQTLYEDRAERVQEESYLNQLHDEVVDVTIEVQRRFTNNNVRKRETTDFLMQAFTTKINIEEFTEAHCQAIVSSYVIVNPVISLPTITEIISSGQLTIVKDKKLRLLISEYERDNDRNTMNRNGLSERTIRLGGKYPNLIKIGPILEGTNALQRGRNHQCDFAAMEENQAFINDLINNSTTFITQLRNFPELLRILNELHDQLDYLLNISHEENI